MEFPAQEDNVAGDNSATNATQSSGSKRDFDDLENNEDDIFASKKARMQMEEAVKMLSSFKESLQNVQDDLATAQAEFDTAKAELQNWKSAFKNESFVPSGKDLEPKFVVDYIQSLRASEKSLKEQLEIAQMKLAIRELKDELELKRVKKQSLDLKMKLDKAEDAFTYMLANLGLKLRAKGIDPTNLSPMAVISLAAEAARDVTCPTPSPGQSDLPQPVQAEHHSADQPHG